VHQDLFTEGPSSLTIHIILPNQHFSWTSYRGAAHLKAQGKDQDVCVDDVLLLCDVLTADWRNEYNQIRPHSSLDHKPPTPEAKRLATLTP
jgi:transposase InsO family protein